MSLATKPARLAIGIGLAGVAVGAAGLSSGDPWRWVAAWIAIACFLAAGAYALNRPDLFGKRSGRLSAGRALPVLPYLVAFRIACWVMRTWRRTPCVSEVEPDLWVGGRVAPHQVPRGAEVVVDLTCEFSAPAAIRRLPGYRSHPVLDGSYPRDEERFLALLDELAKSDAGVLVHCESGRGRAPTAAVLVLLWRGRARDAEEAIAMVRRGRPWTKLTATDLAFIERMALRLAARRAERRANAG
jgi:protein-tyrosine phosphatase